MNATRWLLATCITYTMPAKRRAAVMGYREVGVAAINPLMPSSHLPMRKHHALALAISTLLAGPVVAAVLPDERIDVLYHSYDGGGAEINGPSILVRKNVSASVSVAANYYVDTVSSASIDVQVSASPYSEERKEQGVSAKYMVDRSTINIGYTASKENDYDATTYSVGIDQSFFGDLTTLGFGLSFGEDVVGQNGDPSYKRDLQRRKYSLNASQILTKNLLASLSIDTATDQCLDILDTDSCLNNPYRQVRFINPAAPKGFGEQPEHYPHTRNSDAIGVRFMYHLPYRASLRLDLRQFSDSWGIEAQNAELRYVHTQGAHWLFEIKYRIYDQSAADFYSDLFPYANAQNYLARDKELSPFSSNTLGLGATYKIPAGVIPWFDKSTVNLYWDRFDITYDDFRDARQSMSQFSSAPRYQTGEEPLYRLQANVVRFYVSFWF